jgi:hypothetical protein
MALHLIRPPFEPVGRQVRTPFQDARDVLVEELLRPLRLDDPALRDPYEQIPQRGRMEVQAS